MEKTKYQVIRYHYSTEAIVARFDDWASANRHATSRNKDPRVVAAGAFYSIRMGH